ncbi:hypothetical protein JRO89_XS05G0043000 [Xanthoceras sorbifolium]|uniref:MYB-CC type transcription factor LHEQLE-containing domain-containing protein n=1 Tax=Xanthoceras sorbifolium TaxID=99658 RepID=A0ABQ8I0F0_9ROSI|nr:hypothetical protein JRO89_XS05G0043000 [Xanthoceras sorbifolium]
MNLVLSTDAKPRLKWTPELHQRFVEALNQLGGPDKATPKTLMRVMGIPGLTLNTDWGKTNRLKTALTINKIAERIIISQRTSIDSNVVFIRSLQIAQALQVQMEVQRKLHEQIEVQRHLQLRIEAQGKYLQSVLKKAQETLSGYNSSSVGVELAKAELSQLVSMVNVGCPSSSLSELTDAGATSFKDAEGKLMRSTICSMESSLTSSESSGRKEEKQPMDDTGHTHKSNKISVALPLMDIHPEDKPRKGGSSNQASGRKRSGSTISDGFCEEQPLVRRLDTHNEKSGDQLRNSGKLCKFDLNSQYQNDSESGSKAIDLNCKGLEQLNGFL